MATTVIKGLFGRNLYVGQQNSARRRGPSERHHSLWTRPEDFGIWIMNCKAHDVDNLYVVDGSFFPSSAAVNPALTIMANALASGRPLDETPGSVTKRRGEQNAQPAMDLG
jgi:choline dehydrogenase-like flavoprotein